MARNGAKARGSGWLSLVHWLVLLLVCIVIPGGSWLTASGALAWVMFAKSSSYRVSIAATQRDGTRRRIAPMELGAFAGGYLSRFLSGAERFRHAPAGPSLRAHLAGIAALACQLSSARAVDVVLEERATLDAPILSTRAHRECGFGTRSERAN